MNITKKAITIAMLHSGRTEGHPGPVYSVQEIVDRVNQVFPGGKGTNKDCVYFYASKEGIQLRTSNKVVNKAAYASLMEEIAGGPVQGPSAVATFPVPEDEDNPFLPEAEREITLEELRAQIQAEVDAEFAERAAALAKAEADLEAKQAKVRVVKKADRK